LSLGISPGIRQEGSRLPASYVNFYFANNAIILPAFGYPSRDVEAVNKMKSLLPERKVVSVNEAREIVLGGGCIHCITQQQPFW